MKIWDSVYLWCSCLVWPNINQTFHCYLVIIWMALFVYSSSLARWGGGWHLKNTLYTTLALFAGVMKLARQICHLIVSAICSDPCSHFLSCICCSSFNFRWNFCGHFYSSCSHFGWVDDLMFDHQSFRELQKFGVDFDVRWHLHHWLILSFLQYSGG